MHFASRAQARVDTLNESTPTNLRRIHIIINVKCYNQEYYPDVYWLEPNVSVHILAKDLSYDVMWQAVLMRFFLSPYSLSIVEAG